MALGSGFGMTFSVGIPLVDSFPELFCIARDHGYSGGWPYVWSQ
jgi:hypothetical protein